MKWVKWRCVVSKGGVWILADLALWLWLGSLARFWL